MNQPEPSAKAVALWLKTMSREQLHDQGWATINKRFHGTVRGVRPFLQANFEDAQEQEAALDGFTLALLTVAHFADISQLQTLLTPAGDTATPTNDTALTLPPSGKLPEPEAQ